MGDWGPEDDRRGMKPPPGARAPPGPPTAYRGSGWAASAGGPAPKAGSVYAGPLPVWAGEDWLYEVFGQFGPILRITTKVGHFSQRYAFIDYEFPESRIRAVEGLDGKYSWEGNHLKVTIQKELPGHARVSSSSSPPPTAQASDGSSRVARDGVAYCKERFLSYYGAVQGPREWRAAPPAVEGNRCQCPRHPWFVGEPSPQRTASGSEEGLPIALELPGESLAGEDFIKLFGPLMKNKPPHDGHRDSPPPPPPASAPPPASDRADTLRAAAAADVGRPGASAAPKSPDGAKERAGAAQGAAGKSRAPVENGLLLLRFLEPSVTQKQLARALSAYGTVDAAAIGQGGEGHSAIVVYSARRMAEEAQLAISTRAMPVPAGMEWLSRLEAHVFRSRDVEAPTTKDSNDALQHVLMSLERMAVDRVAKSAAAAAEQRRRREEATAAAAAAAARRAKRAASPPARRSQPLGAGWTVCSASAASRISPAAARLSRLARPPGRAPD
eukprot:TRINITY_DN4269_c1_g2_i1.p1 TRINITY_DN4269_c1_g2~~TRINITY_DN4269_c1_g2_i1.p1  ORF type:complete len:499 (+),score=128.56 TRINITY_DN4269_c1_g2_i1:79-1575(+)